MSARDDLPNLASERLGAVALWASDDFFAERENLLRDHAAEWREHAYTDRGKWMDGWESRRKRAIGADVHDDAIVRLALPGVVREVVVDTSHFRGNFPESMRLEGTTAREGTSVAELLSDATEWIEMAPRSALRGNDQNVFEITSPVAFTHVRLRIFPDGGVARLRVHGEPAPDWRRLGGAAGAIDLAALESGGAVLSCSDMFFGPKHNLIQPGRARNMSDGWETKRRRGVTAETHDWVLLRLAGQGVLHRLELDTAFFLGNFPDTALVEGCDGDPASAEFRPVLARTKLMGHTRHFFVEELLDHGPFTHLRLKVFPDGGVSRLRAWGALTEAARADAAARFLACSSPRELEQRLRTCCAAKRFVSAVSSERPFEDGARLFARTDALVGSFSEPDLFEAMAAHPRIGDRKQGATHEARMSRAEQARASAAPEEVKGALAEANRAYEEKFGFVFLIFATGKSAEEILAQARQRLQNTREAELRIAAGELAKIARLRVLKLVGGE
jgi:allantoicase